MVWNFYSYVSLARCINGLSWKSLEDCGNKLLVRAVKVWRNKLKSQMPFILLSLSVWVSSNFPAWVTSLSSLRAVKAATAAGDDGWSCPEEGCAWKFCWGLEIPQEVWRISCGLVSKKREKKRWGEVSHKSFDITVYILVSYRKSLIISVEITRGKIFEIITLEN